MDFRMTEEAKEARRVGGWEGEMGGVDSSDF
jgi:hypothetical protein